MKIAGLAILLCIGSTIAVAAERLPASIVREYMIAKAATMMAHAPVNDIEKLLAFYADDVVYEDPAVKVRIQGKDGIRSGMLSHVDDYAGSPSETRISIESSVSLANAVAAVTTEVFWAQGSKGREQIQRKRLQVFEFRGDRICRVIDYH